MSLSTAQFLPASQYGMFRKLARVLEHFVAAAPAEVRLDQLAKHCGMSKYAIRKICLRLQEEGLISATENSLYWNLAKPAGGITLEDAWRISMADAPRISTNVPVTGKFTTEMDLLITQALWNIDQSISSHLRCVQLDRVSQSQRTARRWGRRGVRKVKSFL